MLICRRSWTFGIPLGKFKAADRSAVKATHRQDWNFIVARDEMEQPGISDHEEWRYLL
jgi:hypothetical protein